MVSKLLLATQELYFKATQMDEDTNTLRNLGNLYYRIRSGLSSDKTPEQYGAFPYDPYSHTPYKRGAQQPGMTGQVKEEIITRMGELGCSINNEKLIFNPKLLKISEFLTEKATFSYVDVNQKMCELDLSQNQLGFTYCQVPIIYELKDIEQNISILYTDNEIEIIRGDSLSKEISTEIFSRSGKIKEIKVYLRNSYFLF
tara:strand:+ start:21 stop:620 length:600 start_codon:yes stop_codon:yes gene_type:complete